MTTGGPPTRSAGPLMAEEKTLVILDFLVLDKHPRAAADSPLVAPTIDVAEDIGFAVPCSVRMALPSTEPRLVSLKSSVV